MSALLPWTPGRSHRFLSKHAVLRGTATNPSAPNIQQRSTSRQGDSERRLSSPQTTPLDNPAPRIFAGLPGPAKTRAKALQFAMFEPRIGSDLA